MGRAARKFRRHCSYTTDTIGMYALNMSRGQKNQFRKMPLGIKFELAMKFFKSKTGWTFNGAKT